jgi:hypothetical protein
MRDNLAFCLEESPGERENAEDGLGGMTSSSWPPSAWARFRESVHPLSGILSETFVAELSRI